MISPYSWAQCQLDKGNTVELEALVYGLCDRIVISRSVKAQGGVFLARVFEEMRKYRADLMTPSGVSHAFLVDGQAVYLKLHELPVPIKDSEPTIERVGMLVLGDTYH
jgi:hypothetical protein